MKNTGKQILQQKRNELEFANTANINNTGNGNGNMLFSDISKVPQQL